jgi:hypothetical protein
MNGRSLFAETIRSMAAHDDDESRIDAVVVAHVGYQVRT